MAMVGAQEATSSNSRCSYHVFLSFRGFRTVKDDDDIERGENIKFELQKAIQGSRISIVVFSKDYASSSWCLDELVMILKRRKTTGHVVVPIVYHIDPSHVRKQRGSFKEAFTCNEERFQTERSDSRVEWMVKVEKWKGTRIIEGLILDMNLLNEEKYSKPAYGVNRKCHFEEFHNTSLLSNVGNSFKRLCVSIFSWKTMGPSCKKFGKKPRQLSIWAFPPWDPLKSQWLCFQAVTGRKQGSFPCRKQCSRLVQLENMGSLISFTVPSYVNSKIKGSPIWSHRTRVGVRLVYKKKEEKSRQSTNEEASQQISLWNVEHEMSGKTSCPTTTYKI
ncbi:unnamed protein product [Camellia sinensis]